MSAVRLTNLLLAAAAFATIAATVTASDSAAGIRSPSVIGGCCALAAVVCVAASVLHERREQAMARRFVDLTIPPSGAPQTVNLSALPVLAKSSAWYEPLNRLRDFCTTVDERHSSIETARAALEIRLQRTAAQLELTGSILENLGQPVLAVNAYDELQLANRDAEAMFGLKPVGQEKRRVSNVVGSGKLAAIISDVRRKQVPTQRNDDFELDDARGEKRWYRVTTSNLRNDAAPAEEGGAVIVLRDIGAQKVMQKQHAEFVSAASHEMKAPLAGIKAYVELLADGDAEDEDSREEFLGVINGQADRLQRLIDNLLNIARIEAGVVKVSKQSRGVNEILGEAANVVLPNAEAKQITLISDLSPLYLGALVDRDMLLQAVMNLLSNAVKYTPVGGRVELRSRLCDQQIQIEVEDTGVGLSDEDCDRVFEKFYRVDKDKNMAPGTGLGLPLAKHIVEDVHGGKLSVRSKLGVGSTFCITLPNVARNNNASTGDR